MAINIDNYNDVFGKLTKAVDVASASDNEPNFRSTMS